MSKRWLLAIPTWYIPTINLDESFYIYAERPEWTKESFFQTGRLRVHRRSFGVCLALWA